MSLLSAELTATCNALGYYDEKTKKYYADENTLETVKDLIRYLRKDDENHDIRRQLGETKVLQTDLLPLLKSYWEETELFDVLIKLLVNLTTPPLILWNEEVPSDKTVRNYFIQVEDHLRNYKISFADGALWAVLSSRLSAILETEYTERGDDNSLIIERILVLIRNILYVPADPLIERRPDNDANTHDQVSWALHESGILDIILYIASSSHEQAYHVYILEILSHLLREQNATELGKTELHRNHAEKVKNEAELVSIRHRETIKKQQKTKQFSGARHSRFGGTYVVKSMKSISDNELIYHKPLGRLDGITFDADKQKVRTPKNRLPVHMEPIERRSAFTIRLFLKEFCVEFLNGAYNTLMYNVKDQLVRAKSQSHDASFYLWAMRFFMEFNRSYKFQVKLVSETMSIQTFHYVQQQMEKYFDMIQTDKKKLRAWSRRLHIALLAYKELLLTLCFMDKSPDGTVRDSSKVIKSNIYYVLEYRELVLTLMVTYDELKMSDQYLKDLIETQHIFLRSFEAFCKDGSVIVQQASKSRKKKKNVAAAPVEHSLERDWDEASQQLSTVLETNSNIPTDIIPFDATSDVPIDQQKSEAMINVQRKLRRGEYENAVGLLRAAREVWPENDSFGSNHMSPEEEFIALRDIFLANLGENEVAVEQQPIYDENDEEEEDEGRIEFSERDLKFEDFAKRLAHPKIIRAAALALARFEENSVSTNNCIIKLLHRIAFDCKMYVMLFQVSLFTTFRKIYAMKEMPEYKELVKFATYILRQFFKIAQENKKIYLETLFWKSTKDAFDVEHGYGSYQEKSSAAARAWTEEEEDEVRRLFTEHKEKQLEDDVVDWILENLIDNTRTRRGVFKKMKELYLLTDYKGKKKPRLTSRLQQQWTADEEEQLIELYEQFKEAMDPLDCIMSRLDVPRQKNRIIEKLLVLGVIQDRKEVRKKRVKMGTKSRSGGARHNPRRSDDSSDSDASGDDATRRPTVSTNPPRSAGPAKKKKPKKTGVAANVSPRRLAELTLGIMQAGMSEALDWLKESFEDAIEDFDDDADEGIPLVPIMDHAVKAMEHEDFHNLLLALGIAKPSDEQETYWRIPSDMSLETMKSYQELFKRALENNLTIPEEETEVLFTSEIQDIESSDENVFAQLRRSAKTVINEEVHEQAIKSRDTIKRRRESSSDDIPEPGQTATLVRKQKSKKKKTKIVESDVSSDEENVPQIEEVTNVEEIVNVRKSKRRVIDDDDISNNSPTASGFNAEPINDSNNSSDEDIFEKLRKQSHLNSSESESEDEIRVKNRRRIFKRDENVTNEEDLLAIAEEKLKNEKKKNNLAKKKKNNNSKKNTKKCENPKTEKETKKAAKTSSSKNFKSKEFISSEDDSSDDEQSRRRVEEHYEKLLQKDLRDNEKKKEITSEKQEGANNGSSEDEQVVSKNVITRDKAKTSEEDITASSGEIESDIEENSLNTERNKENVDTNQTSNNVGVEKAKRVKKRVFSSDDE